MIEAAVCLIFGAAILLKACWELKIDLESKKYAATRAVFSNANVVKDEGSYQVKLSYEYQAAGKTYIFEQTAQDLSGNVSIMFLSGAEEKAKSYIEKNEDILLYINPENPQRVRVEAGVNPVTVVLIFFGLTFFVVGLRFLIYD